MPEANCCVRPRPLFFKGHSPLPVPTLQLELGRSATGSGAFVPWEQGEWAPIRYGSNVGFHVTVALRVALPGETAAKVKLKVQARGNFECNETAAGAAPVDWLHQDMEWDDAYTNADALSGGIWVRFPVSRDLSFRYCGIWLEIYVAVQEPASGAWGEGSRMVRLYDSNPDF